MKWRVNIDRHAGIDVYVHMTFFLLLVWVAFVHWTRASGIYEVIAGLVFILSIFLCVVFHQIGHALTARYFDIGTRDIILQPIGGVARLERMPRKPSQEIYVALAGPAVNLVIAGLLLLALNLTDSFAPFTSLSVVSGPFMERLMVVNLFLLGFNLLPAFPMDGGRVLPAVLAIRGNYAKATQQAAAIGQGIALLFGLGGLLAGHPMLVFIALFIWIGAAQEATLTKMSSVMQGIPVAQAMVTTFETLSPDEPLAKAVSLTLAGSQTDFPIVVDGNVVGILNQTDLLAGLKSRGEDSTVSAAMQRSFTTVRDDEMLEDAFRKLSDCQCHTLPVFSHQGLIGLLTMDNVGEFIRIQTALVIGKPAPIFPTRRMTHRKREITMKKIWIVPRMFDHEYSC